MKITRSQLKTLIKEEMLLKEGFMDTIRQTTRDFTGKLQAAIRMRHLANRLVNVNPFNDPRSNEFFSDSDNLVGMLRAHGVDWMRPAVGGEKIVDAGELSQTIDAYREDPYGQYERFESVMMNLKNTLDAYIKGGKVE